MDIKYVKKDLNSSYENEALNSILSGQGPDVWAIPNDWVYRHKEKLSPAPPTVLKNSRIVMRDYFVDPIIKDNVFDSQVYGFSPSVDILQAFYNPSLFDNAQTLSRKVNENNEEQRDRIAKILNNFPVTWNEFNQAVPYLTVRNGPNISVAGAAIGTSNNVSHPANILSLLMLQNQTKMLSDDLSQAAFNLPVKNSANQDVFAGRNALDFYTGFSDPGKPNYTWNSSMPSDVEAFVQGKVAIIFGYSSLAGYFRQLYPNFNFEQSKMPQVGEINTIIDFAHYTTYAVPELSPVSQTAWEFIAYLSTDAASTYQSATKEISSRLSDENANLKERGSGAATTAQTKTAQTWNKGRYPVEIDNLFRGAIDRVNNHSQNSQASLDTAAASTTELLRRTTW